MIDLLIVEDEPLIAKRLERFARESLGGKAGKSIFTRHLSDARVEASKLPEDAIIFLDLNLFGKDGFELFEVDVRSPARTIVVSADQSRAIDAFAYGVVDFVAKPFTRERIATAIDRALNGRDPLAPEMKYLAGTSALAGSGIVFTPLENIIALHGADDYVEIEVVDGPRLLTRKSLQVLENTLGSEFFRIHRSHIINRRFVGQFTSLEGSRYQLQMTTGDMLPVGRSRVTAVKAWIGL